MQNVQGHEQVLERLQALDTKTERGIFRVGLKAGANVVLPVAVGLAPRVKGVMAANIQIRGGGSSKQRVSMTVGASQMDFAGPAFYTPFVLWGHKIGKRILRSILRVRPEADTRASVPGDDFILHAFEETKAQALEVTTNTIIERVEAIASGDKS